LISSIAGAFFSRAMVELLGTSGRPPSAKAAGREKTDECRRDVVHRACTVCYLAFLTNSEV
jgi:hypothetical protein